MDKNRMMLDDTIERIHETIANKDEISKEDVDTFVTAYKAKIDEDKIKSDKFDHVLKVGVEVAGIVIPIAFYGVWMAKGFKYEETGSFSSTTFRNLISNFKPKK